ncbi:protein with hydrophobic anchor [Listeria kieliensis]
MKGRRILVLWLALVVFLAGCASVTNTVKVNRDRSAELTFDIKLSNFAGLFSERVSEEIQAKLEKQGFLVQKKSYTHFLVRKKVEKMDEKAISKKELAKYGIKIQEKRGFFMNRYQVEANLDVPKLIGDFGGSDLAISEKLLAQIDYTFVLDLPISHVRDSNADQADGGKLTWKVPLDQKNKLFVEVGIPNVLHIAILAGILVLLLVGIIFMVIRKQRKKRKSLSE